MLGLIVNFAIRLSIFYFLGEVFLLPDDPRFSGKAIPIRNLVIVLTFSLLFPFFYFIKKRWKKYPVWFDNLYLSLFWLDMAGNSLDLYDSYFYFDLFPHFHGSGAFAAFLLGAFNFPALQSIITANLIHGLLEGQEIFTDVFFGTHNVRGPFDTINDMIVGVLGTLLYAGLTYRFIKCKAFKLKAAIIILTVITLTAMFFHKDIAANLKSLLFISESFPQISFKPLTAFTNEPMHSKVVFASFDGKIIGEFFVPREKYTPPSKKKKPAIIISMGVWPGKNRQAILDFASNLSRLGFIVLWPQIDDIRELHILEKPQTFIESFKYLSKRNDVDDKRISYIGLSVGSSISLVAAEDSRINNKVNAVVFFGGYYDAKSYLSSVKTKSASIDGERFSWKPDKEVLEIIEKIKSKKRRIEDIPNPSESIENLKARIFILHDKGDRLVPYSESLKLKEDLPKNVKRTFLLSSLFEHVKPKEGFSFEILTEFAKLYGFVVNVFRYL